jgi:putative endonuclease
MGIAGAHGAAGEALAAAYFELIGCRVVARNTRLGGVEVDLVVEEGRTTVLVEVKTRARSDFGGAAAAVDEAKRERLKRAARAVLAAGRSRVRIDVATVEPNRDGVALRHYRDAVGD